MLITVVLCTCMRWQVFKLSCEFLFDDQSWRSIVSQGHSHVLIYRHGKEGCYVLEGVLLVKELAQVRAPTHVACAFGSGEGAG